MDSIQEYQPAEGWNPNDKPDAWLIFYEQQVVTQADSNWLWREWPLGNKVDEHTAVVCGTADHLRIAVAVVECLPEEGQLVAVRTLLSEYSEAVFQLLSHGLQIIKARHECVFCALCGGQTKPKLGEWSQQCSSCNHLFYPIISPCIIVVIKKQDEVLLVKHHRHGRDTKMHTLVAGFIEPGENAEQAVIREVKEETGLTVANVQYQLSQSWPFPHALMLGFHADYVTGDLVLEAAELCDGGWFHKDALPDLPQKFTLSRQLIERLNN